ncbi:hypothetical protein ZWY2020_018613 [Hordeum vulgare]|nr:hypothetical protein ZWY2020_018613 [Hordeum vulgare]
MPALMAKRSSSGLCAIRRELQQRRKLAGAGTAPKGGIAKKSSACALIQKKPSSASILQHAPVAVADKKQQLDGGSKGTSAAAKEIASVPLGQGPGRAFVDLGEEGMSVKVRTRAGILPTGHCLVLWLGARVVSDAAAYNDGYVEVIYDGNFPRDDPLRTVRVAMDDVRSMPDIAES